MAADREWMNDILTATILQKDGTVIAERRRGGWWQYTSFKCWLLTLAR
jgi:hypothetical protein